MSRDREQSDFNDWMAEVDQVLQEKTGKKSSDFPSSGVLAGCYRVGDDPKAAAQAMLDSISDKEVKAPPIRRMWCVRIVQTKNANGMRMNEGDGISLKFLDCLKFADAITVHEVDPNGLTTLCFDLECPADFSVKREVAATFSKKWADKTAAYMVAKGFNAVAAPSTKS